MSYDHSKHGDIYPLDNRIDTGYDTLFHSGAASYKGRNARLTNPFSESIPLIIEEIETSFQMGGTTAQSAELRQFYPRNFVQPTLTVRGRMPNGFQYNRLASFVRVAQIAALGKRFLRHSGTVRTSKSGTYIPTMLFTVNGSDDKLHARKRHWKGPHKPLRLEGYVKTIQAGAEHHNQAPPFEFEFVAAHSHFSGSVGIYSDDRSEGTEILPWIDIFEARKGKGIYSPTRTKKGSRAVTDDVPDINDDNIEDGPNRGPSGDGTLFP